jgi:alpha-tubulin suppressor-like RCC1 family protein
MEDSTVKAFGYNGYGFMGDGGRVNQLTPKAIEGLVDVHACSAADRHVVCTMEDKTVKTWGYGGNGRLGHGDTVSHGRPKMIEGLEGVRSCSAGFVSNSGQGHTICTMEDSTVKTFGSGDMGMLGHGDELDQLTPRTIEGLVGVRECSGGDGYSVCVMEDSTIKTFGSGYYGGLGHGDKVDQLTPKTVEGLVGVRSCSAYQHAVRTWCIISRAIIYPSLV